MLACVVKRLRAVLSLTVFPPLPPSGGLPHILQPRARPDYRAAVPPEPQRRTNSRCATEILYASMALPNSQAGPAHMWSGMALPPMPRRRRRVTTGSGEVSHHHTAPACSCDVMLCRWGMQVRWGRQNADIATGARWRNFGP